MTRPPIAAADLPEDWPKIVREIVLREGNAVRGPGDRPVIEIKSLVTNQWCVLALPGGGHEFSSYEDRNDILAQIRKP